jgi:ornithine cyclodeaminase/alanine dehydrogenase-like protein (mu-crystallin family)
MSYQITDYTKNKAKEIDVEVKPSQNPKKKLDVFKDGELIASIGANKPLMMDYPTYIIKKGKAYADKRRKLYHQRHQKDSLGEYLALWLLW